jgi:hypothetical protein
MSAKKVVSLHTFTIFPLAMLKVIRFVKFFTMAMFIVALAILYFEVTNDSRMVILYTDIEKRPLLRIEPSYFFYFCAGFFILLNMLLSTTSNLLGRYPVSKLPLPNRDFWLKDQETRQNLREVLQSWMQFLGVVLNFFLAVLMTKIWLVNRMQGGQPHEYLYFVLGLIGILIVWFSFIVYRLRIRREEFVK